MDCGANAKGSNRQLAIRGVAPSEGHRLSQGARIQARKSGLVPNVPSSTQACSELYPPVSGYVVEERLMLPLVTCQVCLQAGSRLLTHLEQSSATVRTSAKVKQKLSKDLSQLQSENANPGHNSIPVLRFEPSEELSHTAVASSAKNKKRKSENKVQSVQSVDERLEVICKENRLDLPSILKWRHLPI